MTKTWSERILNAASKEKEITTQVLRKRLRIPKTEMDPTQFNNSVMRSARYLNENGYLTRTDRGTYRITKTGKKTLA